MVFTSWIGPRKYSLIVEASTSMRIFFIDGHRDAHASNNSIMVVTSCRCGRSTRSRGQIRQQQPAKDGSVAFLRPKCGSRPRAGFRRESAVYPRLWSGKFFGCEHLQREGVDLVAHGRSQRRGKPTWCRCTARFPAKRGATTTASKCTLSRWWNVAWRLPAGLNQAAICCGFMSLPGRCAPTCRRFAPIPRRCRANFSRGRCDPVRLNGELTTSAHSCIPRYHLRMNLASAALDFTDDALSISAVSPQRRKSTACGRRCPASERSLHAPADLSGLPRPNRGDRHGQIGAHRGKIAATLASTGTPAFFVFIGRGESRRHRHDHARRRGVGAVELRRNRRNPHHRPVIKRWAFR